MNAQIVNDRQSIAPILFCQNVLGSKVDIELAKFKGTITLPGLNLKVNSNFKPVIAPQNYNIGVLHLIREEDKNLWGRQIAQPSGATIVESYLMEFELAKTIAKAREQMTLIEQVIDNWFLLLRDWLEILTHQDLSFTEPLGGVQNIGNFFWSWKSKTIWRSTTASSMNIYSNAPDINQAVTLNQWENAVNNTNEGKKPSLEYLLLRDSRARLFRGQFNYSIIFSAIATEIALKEQLKGKLISAKKSKRLIDDVLKNTLGKILEICEVLDVAFPSNTRNDLVKMRNLVMHDDFRSSRKDAIKCLAISDKIVNTYYKI